MVNETYKQAYREISLRRAPGWILAFAMALLLGTVASPVMARPTPTAGASISQVSQAGRLKLSDAEKLAVLFAGSLSLMASVLHRVHTARRL